MQRQRIVLTAEEIAVLVAAKLEEDANEMSYMWDIDGDGLFQGIIVF